MSLDEDDHCGNIVGVPIDISPPRYDLTEVLAGVPGEALGWADLYSRALRGYRHMLISTRSSFAVLLS